MKLLLFKFLFINRVRAEHKAKPIVSLRAGEPKLEWVRLPRILRPMQLRTSLIKGRINMNFDSDSNFFFNNLNI